MAIRRLEDDDFNYEYPFGRPYIPTPRSKGKLGDNSAPVKVYLPPRKGGEREISEAYPEIDTDLARDNLENDLTAADMQDL